MLELVFDPTWIKLFRGIVRRLKTEGKIERDLYKELRKKIKIIEK
jgi:ribosomal protein L19E